MEPPAPKKPKIIVPPRNSAAAIPAAQGGGEEPVGQEEGSVLRKYWKLAKVKVAPEDEGIDWESIDAKRAAEKRMGRTWIDEFVLNPRVEEAVPEEDIAMGEEEDAASEEEEDEDLEEMKDFVVPDDSV